MQMSHPAALSQVCKQMLEADAAVGKFNDSKMQLHAGGLALEDAWSERYSSCTANAAVTWSACCCMLLLLGSPLSVWEQGPSATTASCPGPTVGLLSRHFQPAQPCLVSWHSVSHCATFHSKHRCVAQTCHVCSSIAFLQHYPQLILQCYNPYVLILLHTCC